MDKHYISLPQFQQLRLQYNNLRYEINDGLGKLDLRCERRSGEAGAER